MTTNVTINAQCADTKEVNVCVYEAGEAIENAVLQNGESMMKVVYDSREVTVKEVVKNLFEGKDSTTIINKDTLF